MHPATAVSEDERLARRAAAYTAVAHAHLPHTARAHAAAILHALDAGACPTADQLADLMIATPDLTT
ncbi:hypothetical protein AB0F42_26100 [Streptomyces buecherae]|uniref:hypothetical protein n=1 Tax=Streptomyces buecherae TaxID=2763006 RepID=UPI0033EC372E